MRIPATASKLRRTENRVLKKVPKPTLVPAAIGGRGRPPSVTFKFSRNQQVFTHAEAARFLETSYNKITYATFKGWLRRNADDTYDRAELLRYKQERLKS